MGIPIILWLILSSCCIKIVGMLMAMEAPVFIALSLFFTLRVAISPSFEGLELMKWIFKQFPCFNPSRELLRCEQCCLQRCLELFLLCFLQQQWCNSV